MRVVYDYGIRPISMPRSQDASAVSVGSAASAAQSTAVRRQPVVIVHIGEGARKMEAAGRASGVGGVRRSYGDRRHGDASTIAGSVGAEGIPVPGTDFVLTAGEAAERTDQSVRSHERLHQMTLGPYAESGVLLQTRRGPDGERYAVAGRIKADLSPVPGNPRATLRKANAVRRAALAPASPSAADMRVAAEAYRLAQSARDDLAAERTDTRA